MGKSDHLEQIELAIQGMTCGACAAHVVQVLQDSPGVQKVQVPNWRAGQAIVLGRPDMAVETLLSAIEEMGYTAALEARRPITEADAPYQQAESVHQPRQPDSFWRKLWRSWKNSN